MKLVDVIGGSGFIGTRFAARLLGNDRVSVRILDKKCSADFPTLSLSCDVRSIDNLRDGIRHDAMLVNLAAEHTDDVRPASLYHEVNVGGAENICKVADEKRISTILFVSSVSVYGFAPPGTDEAGPTKPFNEYGKSKLAAELVYRRWQLAEPASRSLIILRPTVVFGENNRGNVYNLMRQIIGGRFVMIGPGQNRKSMAYVENVAAFMEHLLSLGSGIHVLNYVDKPDLSMNELVELVRREAKLPAVLFRRIPYLLGYPAARALDLVSFLTRRKFPVSGIRVKKFCAESVFGSSANQFGFVAPVTLTEGLSRTVKHEFGADQTADRV